MTVKALPIPANWPGIPKAKAIAAQVLAAPPRYDWIERHPVTTPLLWTCVLPAEWCITVNSLRSEPVWKTMARRKAVFDMMLAQHGMRERAHGDWLTRPKVRMVKMNCAAPDAGVDFGKMPLDLLTASQIKRQRNGKIRVEKGLGFFKNDRQARVEYKCWWEYLPRTECGIVLVEVYL